MGPTVGKLAIRRADVNGRLLWGRFFRNGDACGTRGLGPRNLSKRPIAALHRTASVGIMRQRVWLDVGHGQKRASVPI